MTTPTQDELRALGATNQQGVREALASAIRRYCLDQSSASVQISSDDVERIYYAGLSLYGVTDAALAALAQSPANRGEDSRPAVTEHSIAEALAPYFQEGYTPRDGASAVMLLLRTAQTMHPHETAPKDGTPFLAWCPIEPGMGDSDATPDGDWRVVWWETRGQFTSDRDLGNEHFTCWHPLPITPNTPESAGTKSEGLNDQDEVLLAYGLLWCADSTDQRVHSARRELLKCLDKELQAKAIEAARTTLALVRDIRQMKGAAFASDFGGHGDGYCGCTERCKDRDNCQYDVKPSGK